MLCPPTLTFPLPLPSPSHPLPPSHSLVWSENRIWPRGYKTIFMFNSTEHEISLGHKNKNTKNVKLFHAQLSWACSAELSMKEVSKFCQYFKIYKRNRFMLSWVEHEKKCYNLGARYIYVPALVYLIFKYVTRQHKYMNLCTWILFAFLSWVLTVFFSVSIIVPCKPSFFFFVVFIFKFLLNLFLSCPKSRSSDMGSKHYEFATKILKIRKKRNVASYSSNIHTCFMFLALPALYLLFLYFLALAVQHSLLLYFSALRPTFAATLCFERYTSNIHYCVMFWALSVQQSLLL